MTSIVVICACMQIFVHRVRDFVSWRIGCSSSSARPLALIALIADMADMAACTRPSGSAGFESESGSSDSESEFAEFEFESVPPDSESEPSEPSESKTHDPSESKADASVEIVCHVMGANSPNAVFVRSNLPPSVTFGEAMQRVFQMHAFDDREYTMLGPGGTAVDKHIILGDVICKGGNYFQIFRCGCQRGSVLASGQHVANLTPASRSSSRPQGRPAASAAGSAA